MSITIYHNPNCETSRNTLAMIRASGEAPVVVPYLETGWTREQLQTLLSAMGVGPRVVLRDKGAPAAELGLLEPDVSDDAVLEAMLIHPILVNRPIVVTPRGVALCRPSEVVFDLLDHPPQAFTKEDGQVVRPSAP